MDTRKTLEAFDRFLSARALRFDAVVVGGAALNLLGIVARATKDCDVLDPLLSVPVLEAARADCIALAPSADELNMISPWLEQQDANPGWPAHVRETLVDIGRRLDHGV